MLEPVNEVVAKAVRGWMLRMLRWGAGASNSDLLLGLLDRIGLRVSRRFIEEQGEWLISRGYVSISQFEMVTVYRLTRAGDEVARGVVTDDCMAPISLADVLADDALIESFRSERPVEVRGVPKDCG